MTSLPAKIAQKQNGQLIPALPLGVYTSDGFLGETYDELILTPSLQ